VDLERVIQLDPTVTTAYLNFGLVVMQQLKNYHRCLISSCTVLINGLLCAKMFAFGALALLVGWQEGHPTCKKIWGMVEVGTG